MGKIILIGTEHGDLKGSERLESLLEIVSPDVISVESSLESLKLLENDPIDFVQIVSKAREKGVPSNFIQFFNYLIARYGSTPFEYTTSKSYSDKHKIPLYLSDDPILAKAYRDIGFDMLHEIIETLPTNVKISVPTEEDFIKCTDKQYEFGLNALNGKMSQDKIDKFLDIRRGVLIGQRDTYMEQEIKQISIEYPDSRLVHISGFAHLFDDSKKETLYSKIKDLKPERCLIYCQKHTD